jgi:hypothetical protein
MNGMDGMSGMGGMDGMDGIHGMNGMFDRSIPPSRYPSIPPSLHPSIAPSFHPPAHSTPISNSRQMKNAVTAPSSTHAMGCL